MRASSVVGSVSITIAVAVVTIIDADAKEMSFEMTFEMRENWEEEGELERKNRKACLARLGAKILKPSNQYNLCHLRVFLSTKISLD